MKRDYILILSLAVLLIAGNSCKKDSSTATKPYMEGEVKFEFPEYIEAGSPVYTVAYGIEKPENPVYKWVASCMFSDTLVSPVLDATAPTELGSFYVVAYAYADGYYASYTSKEFTTIDLSADGSLKGVPKPETVLVDERDGREYGVVTIGSLQWFSQNLAWDGAGISFHNSAVMDDLFGRLYTWNEVTGGVSGSGLGGGPRGVCPENWSVPTKEDWEDLASAVGGGEKSFDDVWNGLGDSLSVSATLNGNKIWIDSYENLHRNTRSWNALPVGVCLSGKDFLKYGTYAFFWTSYAEEGRAFYRYIYGNEEGGSMPSHYAPLDEWSAPVRCVRIKP